MFKIFGKKKQNPKPNEENTETEMWKLLWFERNEKFFEELTENICNNKDNNNFKIIINKKTYDFKHAKKIWTEVTTHKITKSETKELHNELIQKEIDALEREKVMALENVISWIFSKIRLNSHWPLFSLQRCT